MRVTILDTNVLRGLSDDQFDRLKARELELGIRQYADPWTMMELIAHLRNTDDPAYWSCRRALRRCARRAQLPLGEPPRVVAPAELQFSRAVFGESSQEQEENVAAFVELARSLAFADDADDLAAFSADIDTIAQHIEEKEQWFAEYFEALRRQVLKATESSTNSERNAEVRKFTRSDDALRLDATALVNRAYRQAGRQPPDPLPVDVIERVMAASRPGSYAVGLLLERIMCDNVNLAKSGIRNLLWDQEVAGSVGQTIEGMSILIVTQDAYFAEAAKMSGHENAVCTLDEYLTKLGLDAA